MPDHGFGRSDGHHKMVDYAASRVGEAVSQQENYAKQQECAVEKVRARQDSGL